MLEIISKTDRYFEVPFTINFHGGEPLLMIDHIKLVGEQIEKGVYKNQTVSFLYFARYHL